MSTSDSTMERRGGRQSIVNLEEQKAVLSKYKIYFKFRDRLPKHSDIVFKKICRDLRYKMTQRAVKLSVMRHYDYFFDELEDQTNGNFDQLNNRRMPDGVILNKDKQQSTMKRKGGRKSIVKLEDQKTVISKYKIYLKSRDRLPKYSDIVFKNICRDLGYKMTQRAIKLSVMRNYDYFFDELKYQTNGNFENEFRTAMSVLRSYRNEGIVKEITLHPLFYIPYSTTEQDIHYEQLSKRERVVITFNVTSDLIKKWKTFQTNKILNFNLYSVLAIEDEKNVPVTQMLSEGPDSKAFATTWLKDWLKNKRKPDEIILNTDLQSTLTAAVKLFTKKSSTEEYLKESFKMLNDSIATNETYISMDLNVFLNAILNVTSGFKAANEKQKSFYLQCILLIASFQNYEEVQKVFKDLIIICLNKFDVQRCVEAKDRLWELLVDIDTSGVDEKFYDILYYDGCEECKILEMKFDRTVRNKNLQKTKPGEHMVAKANKNLNNVEKQKNKTSISTCEIQQDKKRPMEIEFINIIGEDISLSTEVELEIEEERISDDDDIKTTNKTSEIEQRFDDSILNEKHLKRLVGSGGYLFNSNFLRNLTEKAELNFTAVNCLDEDEYCSQLEEMTEEGTNNEEKYYYPPWYRYHVVKEYSIIDSKKESGPRNLFHLPTMIHTLTMLIIQLPLWSNVMMPIYKSTIKVPTTSKTKRYIDSLKQFVFKEVQSKQMRVDKFFLKHVEFLNKKFKKGL